MTTDQPGGGVAGGRDMRRAVLAVAGAAVLWSSGGLFIKLAPMPALAVACGRSLIAGVFYLLVLRPNLRAARWTTAAAYASESSEMYSAIAWSSLYASGCHPI